MSSKKEYKTVIPLTKNRYLLSDGYAMWIASRVHKADGDYYKRQSGYYTTFSSLFDGFVREGLKALGDCEEVDKALARMAGVERDLRKIAKIIGKEIDDKNA